MRKSSGKNTGQRAVGGQLRVLCVHGVGNAEADRDFRFQWTTAIQESVRIWRSDLSAEIEFLKYDEIFAEAPIDPQDIAIAMGKLAVSGVVHGVGDFFGGLFGRERAFGDIGDTLRWTAGMVVQWVENEKVRTNAREAFLSLAKEFKPDVVLAHSLGSLIAYEALVRPKNAQVLKDGVFVSLGSQIGNPFVRSSVALAGRVEPLGQVRHWFHLFNRHDNAFTSPIRLHSFNYTQVEARFDDPGLLDHDAISYLTHSNTRGTVWRKILSVDPSPARAYSAAKKRDDMDAAFIKVAERPRRRALLVGINEYPNPANRLDGCVNDVFLMSSVLQESGFDAEDIRVVLNDRATAAGIMERLNWLLEGAQDGQERIFYYSGHGAQLPGYGAFESVNASDECLVAYDFNWTREHAITDDQFCELYSQLPYGTRFLTIFDCCHSGGLTRDGSAKARGVNPPDDIRHRALRWDAKEKMWKTRDLDAGGRNLSEEERKRFFGDSEAKHRLGCASELRKSMGDEYERTAQELGHKGPFMPIILKACSENEFAYEYRHGVISYGAFTYCLAEQFRSDREGGVSWKQLVTKVRQKVQRLGYNQRPDIDGPTRMISSKVPW